MEYCINVHKILETVGILRRKFSCLKKIGSKHPSTYSVVVFFGICELSGDHIADVCTDDRDPDASKKIQFIDAGPDDEEGPASCKLISQGFYCNYVTYVEILMGIFWGG